MITIKLVDARRGLHAKCVELFKDATIAESIYRYLCDGIEECEYAESQRKKGKWMDNPIDVCSIAKHCSRCGYTCLGYDSSNGHKFSFCPHCGADMREERQ